MARMPRHTGLSLIIATVVLLGATVAAQSRQPAAKPPVYSASDIASGRTLFAAHCGFCHGRDTLGGETGPDLTRSALVQQDVRGDKIKPLVKSGRPEKGMPPIDLSDRQLTSIVAFIHDARDNSGAVLGARRKVADDDLRSGDANAGREYFDGAGACTRCHSATGDLADVADRLQGLTLLQ